MGGEGREWIAPAEASNMGSKKKKKEKRAGGAAAANAVRRMHTGEGREDAAERRRI